MGSSEVGCDGRRFGGPTLLASPGLGWQKSPASEFCKSPNLGPGEYETLQCAFALDDPIPSACRIPALGAQAFPSLVCHGKDEKQGKCIALAGSKDTPAPCRQGQTGKKFDFIEIDMSCPETQASERLQAFIKAAGALWNTSAGFGGEMLDFFSDHPESKFTVLVQQDLFVGFLVYKVNVKNKKTSLSIRRVAVSPDFQRQGHAGRIIEWCIRVPKVCYLEATSTVKALPFYKAFGFKKTETWHTGGTAHPDDEPTGNQVYMEYHPGNHKGRKNKVRK